MPRTLTRMLAGGAAAAAFAASAAYAHHGWSWAEADQIELTGTIEEIYIGPPHPTLRLKTDDGVWQIELGNPRQTERSGFVEGTAEVGDEVTLLGNRSEDRGEKRLKAVRLTLDGKQFDIYPERINR